MQDICCIGIIGCAIDFCAIAGRQDGGFGQAGLIRSKQMLAKIVQRFLEKFRIKGDLFPNGDRRCVMIDAECQQLHNGDYRFDDSIYGGNNGVFGFSANWGCIRRIGLDFLPWHFLSEPKPAKTFAARPGGLYCCRLKLLFRPIPWVFSIRPNAGMALRHLCLLMVCVIGCAPRCE